MDLITTAVVGWATTEFGRAGMRGLQRQVLGDKQQNALRTVVSQAVCSAVAEVVPLDRQDDVQEALTRELPYSGAPSLPFWGWSGRA